jgi:hypothetical protein
MSLTVYIFELLVWPFFPSSLFCFCCFEGETSNLLKAAAHFASEGKALEGEDSLLVGRMGISGISRSALDSAQCKNYEEIYVTIDQDHVNPDLEMALYIQFLEVIRDLKEKRNFTNIERNIYLGLQDNPTLTGLCVLILYAQSITHPYMRQVCGPTAQATNLLDLGPLHDKVINHCRTIINNPDLLLSSEASYSTGSLDGQIWERMDAFYAVHALSPCLPHLRGAMVTFFDGAVEKWIHFTSDFEAEGTIASSSSTERCRAYMQPTNDSNKGGLGEKRVLTRHAPNMTLESHNACAMYRKNDTAAFIHKTLNFADCKYLQQKAREIDGSGQAKKRREAQAVAYKETVETFTWDKHRSRSTT